MTESQFSSKVGVHLKNRGAVVFKISDRFTSGIPDTHVTVHDMATWIEFKLLKRGENFYERVHRDKVQFWNMQLLARMYRAWYIIGTPERTMHFFNPISFSNNLGTAYRFKGPESLGTWISQTDTEWSWITSITDYESINQLVRTPK